MAEVKNVKSNLLER